MQSRFLNTRKAMQLSHNPGSIIFYMTVNIIGQNDGEVNLMDNLKPTYSISMCTQI